MDQLTPVEIKQFQARILDWYALHQRDLPWRQIHFDTSLQQRDPYKILLSEIMAQQTQIARVIPKYEVWLETLPTIEALANAPMSEVLRLWSGLGYNRRALNLKKAAEKLVNEFHGEFPRSEKELRSLPGIGEYTARALLCFAFDQQVAVVDTNVRKVISTEVINRHCEKQSDEAISSIRLTRSLQSLAMTDKEIQKIADQLLPAGRAYEWNQALMDYASSVLKDHKIPIPKQSKFKGSHRYYRGQLLKTLLEKKQLSILELGEIIKKDYEEIWLRNLVYELRDEGFVQIENDDVRLA